MERLRTCTTGSAALAFYVAERRKMATGTQLTAGEALRQLRISSPTPRDYRALRAIDAGIRHRDAAGRRHTLYTWGDLDVIAENFRGRSPAPPKARDPLPPPPEAESGHHESGEEPGEIPFNERLAAFEELRRETQAAGSTESVSSG